jgi:hypothetical protein
VFKPVVGAIKLQPGSIASLRGRDDSAELVPATDAQIQWSQNPGCFERCLQIRHNNPLFPAARRQIEQRELLAARERDREERKVLQAEMTRQIEELSSFPQPMAFKQLNGYRMRIEALIQRASEIGSSVEDHRAALWQFWESIVKDTEASVALWEVGADAALERAREMHRISKERHIRYGNFALAQLVRKDSPVPQEELPAFILSHDPDTIRQVMSDYDPEPKAAIGGFYESLLRTAQAEGLPIAEAEEKLKALRA